MHCPKCGTELELSLTPARQDSVTPLRDLAGCPSLPARRNKNFVMNGKQYTLSDRDVLEAAATFERPETIRTYSVELPNREGSIQEFPIKQVVREALRTRFPEEFSDEEDKKSFTANRARDILTGLGFTVRRR